MAELLTNITNYQRNANMGLGDRVPGTSRNSDLSESVYDFEGDVESGDTIAIDDLIPAGFHLVPRLSSVSGDKAVSGIQLQSLDKDGDTTNLTTAIATTTTGEIPFVAASNLGDGVIGEGNKLQATIGATVSAVKLRFRLVFRQLS